MLPWKNCLTYGQVPSLSLQSKPNPFLIHPVLTYTFIKLVVLGVYLTSLRACSVRQDFYYNIGIFVAVVDAFSIFHCVYVLRRYYCAGLYCWASHCCV